MKVVVKAAPGLAKASLANSPAGAGNGTTASAHGEKYPHTDTQHSNVTDLASSSYPNRGDRLQDTRVWVARLTDAGVPEPPVPASGPGSEHYHPGALVMSPRGSLAGDAATTAAAVALASPSAGSVASRRFGPRFSDDSFAPRRSCATPIPTDPKGPVAGDRGEMVAVAAAGGRSSNWSTVTHAAAATGTAAAATAAVGGVSPRGAAAVAATGGDDSSAASGGGSSGDSAPSKPFVSLPLPAPGPHARSSSTASSVATITSTHSSLLELLDAAAAMPYGDFSTTSGAVPPPSSPLGSPTASVTVAVTTSTAAAAAAGLLAAACGSPVVKKQSFTSYGRDRSLRLSYQGELPPAGTGAPPGDGNGPSSYDEAPLLSAYVAAMPSVGSAPLNETVRIASKRHRSASDGLWPAPSHQQHHQHHGQHHQHGGLLDPTSPTHLPSAVPQWRQHQLQHKQPLPHQQQQHHHQQQQQQPHLQRRPSLEKQRLPLVWVHGAIAVLDQVAAPAATAAAAGGGAKYGTTSGPARDSHRACTGTGAPADAATTNSNSNNSGDSHSDVGSRWSTDSDGLRLPPLLVAHRSLRASIDGEPPTASSTAAAAAACRPRPAGHSLFTDSLDEFDGWQQPQQPQLQSPPPGGCGGGGGGCIMSGPGRLRGATASRSGTGYGTGCGSGCPWDDGGGALSVSQLRSNSCSSTDRIPGAPAPRSPAATASGTAATDSVAGGGVSASTAALMAGVRAFHRESAEMCAKAVSVAAMAAAEVERRVYGCADGGGYCTTASPPIGCRPRPSAGSLCSAAAPAPPPAGVCEPVPASPSRPGGGLRLRVATDGGVGDGDGSPSPATTPAAAASGRDSPVGAACSPTQAYYSRAPVRAAPSPAGLTGVVEAAATATKPRPQASLLAGLQPSALIAASPSGVAAASCPAVRSQTGAATAAARSAAAAATPAGAPAPLWTSSFSSSSTGTAPPSPLSPRPPAPAPAAPQPPPGAPHGTARLHVPRPPAATAPSEHPPLHQLQHQVTTTAVAASSLSHGACSPTAIAAAAVAEPRRRQPAPPPAPAPLPACRSHRTSQLSAVSEEEPAPPAS